MEKLTVKLKSLAKRNQEEKITYKPLLLDFKKSNDKKIISKIIASPGVKVHDNLYGQLAELIRITHPKKKFAPHELQLAIKKHLGKNTLADYGVWVHYPWSNRLVHILPKEEFIKVRTSRNHYKITPEEQALLATKKVGIIGLSVGQSVSVTLAMERICGELRLADFDVLELTNLNRIRTGLHNLNLPKVYSVAREISELDPYINIVCFPEGLNEDNLTAFFTKGGKLDLMVEESDGFDIKILSRYRARELKIPVIMEASDRCMVDVERFDLEKNRPVLHGLVDHLKIDALKKLKTTEEKIPYMLDVLGIESSSLRLRASMLEIDQSINTWPQLASAVTMGGGITADVSRRILLNSFTDSGRYYVDVEQIIGNKNKPVVKTPNPAVELNFDFKRAAESQQPLFHQNQLKLGEATVRKMVLNACKAPSGGNAQPWRWIHKNGCLLLFNPFKPNQTILDYEGFASLIAIGAAIENLDLTAKSLSLQATYEFFPSNYGYNPVAICRFFKAQKPDQKILDRCKAIDVRFTNRKISSREAINPGLLKGLTATAQEHGGANLHFITNSEQLAAAGELLGELEKIRLLEKMGHQDFVREIRWTEEENLLTRDGVDIRTVDLTNSELAGFTIARDAAVMDLLTAWKGGDAFKKLTIKAIDGAGAVGVITLKGKSKQDYLDAGRVLERVWIEANRNNLAFHPVSAGLFIYARLLRGKGIGLSKNAVTQLKQLRPRFEQTFLISNDSQEMFIFRLTKCGQPEVKSLRKPLKDLYCYL